MKTKLTLAVLLVFIVFHAPWRLMVLVAEATAMTPSFTRISEDDSKYWEALDLQNRLAWFGWNVRYEHGLNYNGNEVYGLTDRESHRIFIEKRLHWTQTYIVLAHEAGHILAPGWIASDESQSEVFAESVAAIATHTGLREHARYLSQHKESLWVVVMEWRRIYRAAALLEQ